MLRRAVFDVMAWCEVADMVWALHHLWEPVFLVLPWYTVAAALSVFTAGLYFAVLFSVSITTLVRPHPQLPPVVPVPPSPAPLPPPVSSRCFLHRSSLCGVEA